MATFDDMSVRLSRRLRDPVASSTTDGKVFSSAQRTSYLNEAILLLESIIWGLDESENKSLVWRILQSEVKTMPLMVAAIGTPVPADWTDKPLYMVSENGEYFTANDKSVLSANLTPEFDSAFAVENDRVYVYTNGKLGG